jgi:prepilin-type N-terminal cleavage/methylation domain-containing protein
MQHRLNRKSHRAFTLLEVLIVVVLLGILAAIMTPSVASARRDARDGRRMQDMRAVEKALEMYINDWGVYPIVSGWSADAPSYGGRGYTGPTGYIPGLGPDYILELPRDPNGAYPSGGRGYLYYSDGFDYKFLAHQTPDSFPVDNPLFDPVRPTWAWAIFTPGGRNW